MKLYELFKGTEYVGEFTLDEIISITGIWASNDKLSEPDQKYGEGSL